MAGSTPRRVDFQDGLPVGLRSFLVSGRGRLMNLSSSGAYVATPMYLLPQARVRLSIVLREEKRWIETDAVVVWENRGTVGRRDGLPPGYGLRFVDVESDAEQAIEKLLKGEIVVNERPARRGGARPAFLPEAPLPPLPLLEPSQTMPPLPAAPPLHATQPIPPVPAVQPPQVVHPPQEEELEGPPFRLRKDVIGAKIPMRTAGIFVLSYDRTQETRVGRADQDLRATLASFEGEYAYFYFEAIEAAEERFFRECELYHRLGGDRRQLDNTSHPEPSGPDEFECPVCVAAKLR